MCEEDKTASLFAYVDHEIHSSQRSIFRVGWFVIEESRNYDLVCKWLDNHCVKSMEHKDLICMAVETCSDSGNFILSRACLDGKYAEARNND